MTGVSADNIYTSTGQQVVVQYIIPSDLYNSAINDNQKDEITEPNA